jgi:hypothetical protein
MSGAGGDRTQVSSHWIGHLTGTSSPFNPAEPFVLAGIDWAGPANARIELRSLGQDRRWSRWANASVQGHDSDGGRSPVHALFGEPVWTGPAIAVQLRSSRPVTGLSVHLVAARRPAGRLATHPLAQAAAALPLAKPKLPAGPGQPAIIARSAWAGTHGPRVTPEYGAVRMAFVHHSDGANGYSRAQVPDVLLSIYDFHVYVRGWNDIGYNFAIDRFGRVWEARAGGIDQAVVGAQAGGYNLESTGVVILGSYDSVLPSQSALTTLEHVLAWKLALHGVPVTGKVKVEVNPSDAFYTPFRPGQRVTLPRIAGHRDGCTTDCPGDDLYHYLPKVRAAVQKLVGTQVQLSLALTGGNRHPSTDLALGFTRIKAGQQISLAGRLRTLKGAAMPAAPIELQSVDGHVEQVIATATTDQRGDWAVQLEPTANLLLRALHVAAPAVASPLVVIAVVPVVTLALTTPGQQTVDGTVSPPKPTVVITAHAATGRKRLVKQVTVSVTAGKFIHTFALKPGAYVLQAHTLADAANVQGSSPKVALTV